jgi:hypothetical protein
VEFSCWHWGVIGEYLGRMYEAAKARPIYIIEQVYAHLNGEAVGRQPTHLRTPDLTDR